MKEKEQAIMTNTIPWCDAISSKSAKDLWPVISYLRQVFILRQTSSSDLLTALLA